MTHFFLYRPAVLVLLFTQIIFISQVFPQGFNISSENAGLSIGNSKEFTGLRLNFRDKDVREKIGLLNYIKDNPTIFKLLPLFNFSFK